MYNAYTIHTRTHALDVWCNKNFYISGSHVLNFVFTKILLSIHAKCLKLKQQQQQQQQLQFDTLLYRWVQFCVSTSPNVKPAISFCGGEARG